MHLGEKADLEAVKGEAGGGVRVRAKESEAVVDSVLVGLGRRPNVSHLGLENWGVELDEDGTAALRSCTPCKSAIYPFSN